MTSTTESPRLAPCYADIYVFPVVPSMEHNAQGTRCAVTMGGRLLANVADADAAADYIRHRWQRGNHPPAWIVEEPGDVRPFVL